MLSLSYTLFLNKMLGQLYVVGLDPFYGALHELTFGRQSLALDLMEEFRPIIDNFILTLVNKNQIGKKHFEYNKINEEDPELSSKLPVMFSSDGMKKFVQNFSKFMKQKFFINDLNAQFQLSDILKLQCRKYIRHINNRERYKGFQWS